MLQLAYILLIATLVGYLSKHLILRNKAAKSARLHADLNWKNAQ